MKTRSTLVAMVPVVLCSTGASAIVTRHDISDQAYLDFAQESQFAPIGRMIFQDNGSLYFSGSGTLIGEQWVLTAAHVAENAADGDWFFDTGSGTERAQADQVYYHPDWFGDGSTNGDMALIHLAEPVLNVTPANLWSGGSSVGQEVALIGYGGTGNGVDGWDGGYDLQRRAGTNIVESPSLFGTDEYLGFDFDDPRADFSTSLEAMLMFGDSGGAIMAEGVNGWELIGVNTFIISTEGEYGLYGDLMGATSVSFHHDWIMSVIPSPSGLSVLGLGLLGVSRRRRHAA